MIVEHEFALRWASALPAIAPIGSVFQNTYWTVYERQATPLSDVEARRMRRYVAAHVSALSHAWTVSEVDRAELRRLAPGLAIDVVPQRRRRSPLRPPQRRGRARPPALQRHARLPAERGGHRVVRR